MTQKYPGGFVTLTPPTLDPALGAATQGIWTLDQALNAEVTRSWPMYDPYYRNVVLNLHGNGTNGAQNNQFLDSSSNVVSITPNGNVTQGSFSPYGQFWSNNFPNTNTGSDNLTIAHDASLSFTAANDFTVESWVYLTAHNTYSHFVSKGNGTSREWAFGLNSTSLFFYWSTDGNSTGDSLISSSYTFQLNTWYHVAMSKSGSSVRLFVNGVQQGATGTFTTIYNGSSPFRIATFMDFTGISHCFAGYLSNLRVVKNTAVYTSNFTPSSAPLTAITNTSVLTCQSNRFVDNSASPRTITVNGTPSVQRFQPFLFPTSYTPSTIGGSGYFDGTGDYLTTPQTSAFNLGTGAFTVEAFVYLTAYPSGGTTNIIGLGQGAATGVYSAWNFLIQTDGTLGWYRYDGSTETSYFTSIAIPLNQWTHVVAVRNVSSNLSLYVKGARGYNNASATTSYNNINSDPIYLSNVRSGATPTNRYMTGYMTDVRVVNGSAVYDPTSSTLTVPTSPLTAITNTSLLLNYTNAAIYDNSMMNDLETVGNAQISTSQKKYGTGSIAFDGTGDYLAVRASPNFAFGTGDFTLECWIYVSSNPAQYTCIMSNWAGADPAWLLDFSNTSGNIRFNDSSAAYLTSSSALPTGQWNHVAVSRSGTSLKMFFNGSSVASATNSTSFGSASSGVFIGAYYNNTYPLNGYIDDLRITKGVARYVANFTPPTSQLQDQ